MESEKQKGMRALNKREFAKAKNHFKRHYKETQNRWEYFNSIGNVFYAQELYKEATQYYQNALNANKRSGLAYSNLTAALGEQKQYTKAINAAEKALKLLPSEMGGIHKNLLQASAMIKRERSVAKDLHILRHSID